MAFHIQIVYLVYNVTTFIELVSNDHVLDALNESREWDEEKDVPSIAVADWRERE